MGSEDDHRRKSRKHSRSGLRKHRSSRGSSDRHRDSGRRKESERKSKEEDDDGRNGRKGKTLTEEEEKLYAKAREYLQREEKDSHRRKHKDSKQQRRRRRSDSHDSSDANSSRRDRKSHRSSKKEHKRSKRDDDRGDKKSSRHKKKSKHGHNRDEEEKHKKKKDGSKSESSFKDQASKIDSTKLVSLGNIVHKPPVEQLDSDTNYFSHSSHLRLYLYRQFGIHFENLTSSESHDAFKEFTESYNAGNLEEAYYDPSGLLPQDALDQCSRTKHQWKFKTNRLEEQSLNYVKVGVKKQTEYKDGTTATIATAASSAGKSMIPNRQPARGSNKFNHTDDNSQQRKTPQELAAQRQSDKQHRERIKLANEEMYGAGKADHGWERKREKRREKSEKLHGAGRDRESEAWGGAELDDDAIYGSTGGVGGGGRRGRGGEASYEEAVAKGRQYRERKEAEKAARTSELLKKEEEKQKKMLEMLGLSGIKAGQKIKIAPRND
ncbi:hypothetical protein ACHAXR_009249 [Thalassiosira sp. AJA248-18]